MVEFRILPGFRIKQYLFNREIIVMLHPRLYMPVLPYPKGQGGYMVVVPNIQLVINIL